MPQTIMWFRMGVLILGATSLQCAVLGADPEIQSSRQDLDKLVLLSKSYLFNPRDLTRVRVPFVARTAWGKTVTIEREGWLEPQAANAPARVIFTDGESIPAPMEEQIERLDFTAEARKLCERLKPSPPPPLDKNDADDLEPPDAWLDSDTPPVAVDDNWPENRALELASAPYEESLTTLAIWLYQRDEIALAAEMLEIAYYWHSVGERSSGQLAESKNRSVEKLMDRLVADLAWRAFSTAVHCYGMHADEEALANSERLMRLYPEFAHADPAADALVAELKRRKQLGTLGAATAKFPPDGFGDWPVERQVATCIAVLDEVDARQRGQPGGVDMAEDSRVQALIRIGDPAVPALLDVIENDKRLTRSVQFWRDFDRDRTVLGVSEAALTALMSILRVRVFSPVATGDSFSARDADDQNQVVTELREYWRLYGKLSFDERMMRVLTNDNASPEAWREAAFNLATFGAEENIATTFQPLRPVRLVAGPNPTVKKFSKPTVAEAMIAAWDRESEAHDAKKLGHSLNVEQIDDSYLEALRALGDERVVPELTRRFKAAKRADLRCWLALTAKALGDPSLIDVLAAELEAGGADWSSPLSRLAKADGRSDFEALLETLVQSATPGADRALRAVAEPTHPLHGFAAALIQEKLVKQMSHSVLFWNPFCLAFLREQLDDRTPSGTTYSEVKGWLRERYSNGLGWQPLPAILADPATRKTEAVSLARDAAANRLHELVLGAPDYHPLLKDGDERIESLKQLTDPARGSFRLLTEAERGALKIAGEPVYIRVTGLLNRVATREDVRTGAAIFALDDEPRLAPLRLPATGVLSDAKQPQQRVLIVQAEINKVGVVHYAIVGPEGIRAITGDAITDVESIQSSGE